MDKYASIANKIPTSIKQAIHRALVQIGINDPSIEIQIEHPSVEKHGDYSSNISMVIFSNFKDQEKRKINSPHQLAEQLVDLLKKDTPLLDLVKEVTVAGPGFVNFFIKTELLAQELFTIQTQRQNYGTNNKLKGKKILVEYAHPNTHKELHIGHMRTLITGESISRIMEANNADVFRANYQGDIGPHVAKSIWGAQKLLQQKGESWEIADKLSHVEKAKLLGDGYVLASRKYEDHKKEIDQLNKKIYQHDSEIEPIYQMTRKWSLDYYQDFYGRFYTEFDKLYFESQVATDGKETVNQNIGNVFTKSDGAVIFEGEKYGLHNRVFITKDNNPTYEAKEIGLAPQQYNDFPFDQAIHVVANEQEGYFQVVIKVLELIFPELKDKEYHLSMGMVNLVGMKISSRKGNIVRVDDLIEQIKNKIRPLIKREAITDIEAEKIAEEVTIGAIKYTMLNVNPSMNVAFDIEKSISIQGNSGPYIQYTHARCQSVIGKSNTKSEDLVSNIDPQTLKTNPEELSVLRQLYQFPEVVINSAQEYVPTYICTYLHELSQLYNSFYNKHAILGADDNSQKQFRLQLTSATAQVLKNGLYLLGINAPSKM